MAHSDEASLQAAPTAVETPDQAQDHEEVTMALDSLGSGLAPQAPLAATQIFISYRISSDQKVASALKKLLEGSIDPPPRVFVSGDGGILPSSAGAIPQLQEAVQRSEAFIGIITQQSKQREWIFFEAGAAWGRRRIYVPLLIDATPDDLPNTIQSYQTTDAKQKSAMHTLMGVLAKATEGTLRSHFGRRYASFERVVVSYPNDPEDSDQDDVDPSADLRRAIKLLQAGRNTEADEQFNQLETGAQSDQAALSAVQLARILHDERTTRHEKLLRLEAMQPPAKENPEHHSWLGIYEDTVHRRLSHYTNCLSRQPDTFIRRLTVILRAQAMLDIGRKEECLAVLNEALKDVDRELRTAAAAKLLERFETSAGPTRLLLGCYGGGEAVIGESAKCLNAAIDIASERGWHEVAMALASQLDRRHKDAQSANRLGIVLQNAGFPSLAYLAFDRAASTGASVAKANIASLLGGSAVASAGLRVLEQHVGSFDALHPDYPHQVRASLEQSVRVERERARESERRGSLVFQRLCEFMNIANQCSSDASAIGRYSSESIVYKSIKTATGIELAPLEEQGDKRVLKLAFPLSNVFVEDVSSDVFLLYTIAASGDLEGVRCTLTFGQCEAAIATLAWHEGAPATAPADQSGALS